MMRYLTMTLLILTLLAVAFAGRAGADLPPQGEALPQVALIPTNDVPTDTVEARAWLPEIATNWPVPVRPGEWRDYSGDTLNLWFTVTDDRRLCDFHHLIFPCGVGPSVLDGCTGIAPDGSVNFDATVHYRGRFESPTELHGTWSFHPGRCEESGMWAAQWWNDR